MKHTLLKTRIQDYFKRLELPEHPTIYDYLILSLRPKDVIATFNWDPFLYQAFNRNGKFSFTPPPGILHLHGNVAIGYCSKERRSGPAGSIIKDTGEYCSPTKLLYPVTKKDYNSSEFIKGQWKDLKDAERVTVFGYRAPDSDVEAMELMQEAWGSPEQRAMEQFELIDIRPEEEVKKSWSKFIHSHHYDYHTTFFDSSLARHPRRTIESYRLWSQPMKINHAFQEGNKVPNNFKDLKEMWEWYKPLMEKDWESDKYTLPSELHGPASDQVDNNG